MESYRTEEEQVEALKRWWDENGRSMIVGVVLALGLGFGWQAWQKSSELAAENASTLYQQMLMALAAADESGAAPGRALAERLKDEHGGSAYAQFAGLHLARLAVNEGDLGVAEQELRGVVATASSGSEIHQVAQLRLARVVAASGDSEAALAMLDGATTDFVASYAMARGDILLNQGRESEALLAYESALAALDPMAPAPPALEQKIQYLSSRLASEVE